MKRAWLAVFPAVLALAGAATVPAAETTTIFRSGDNGINSCRIPAVVAAKDGALFAVTEGRKKSWLDKSPTCLLGSVSKDGGKTWSRPVVITDAGDDALMDPCPVYDAATGEIHLFCTRWGAPAKKGGKQTVTGVYRLVSKDGGENWSKPESMAALLLHGSCHTGGFGPGSGIELAGGPHKGRLVIPMRQTDKNIAGGCRVVHSDDHGKSWRLGREPTKGLEGECQIAEPAPGVLLMNVRDGNKRMQARSEDDGESWGPPSLAKELVTPKNGCQGSVLRYGGVPGAVIYSGPEDALERKNLTLRLSRDGGASWPGRIVLDTKAAGYSCLVLFPGGDVGVVYEAGPDAEFSREKERPAGWMNIVFQRVPAARIKTALDGAK
jgi:sialidase-1